MRGGIGSSPDGQPHVVLYSSVDDLAKYLERAEGLGGTVMMPATQVDEHTSIAVLTDPQGTAFGIYTSTD
jgi:predicted enzyme related to lactoylglutathione lyase